MVALCVDTPGEADVWVLERVWKEFIVEVLLDAEDHGQPEEHVVAQPVVDELVGVLARKDHAHLVVVKVWSLTQFYSVDFSPSRISVKKCVFNKHTIKICVREHPNSTYG